MEVTGTIRGTMDVNTALNNVISVVRGYVCNAEQRELLTISLLVIQERLAVADAADKAAAEATAAAEKAAAEATAAAEAVKEKASASLQ
jgi:hypothetical protein